MADVNTRAHLRTRVPTQGSGGDWIWHWFLASMLDAAAEVVVRCDRTVGAGIRIRDFHLEVRANPGDYIDFSAELSQWDAGRRVVEVVARREVAVVGTGGERFHVLPHAEIVGAGTFEFPVPDREGVGKGLPEPVVITVAPTGFDVTKQDSPHVPVTPEEVAEEVARAAVEGASVVHLHVRGPDGGPSYDPGLIGDAVELIRNRCDVVVQISTEGPADLPVERRTAGVGVPGVEMASIVTGSTNYGDHIVFNSKPVMEHVAMVLRQAGMPPVVEVLDVGFLENAKALARKGLIPLPAHFVLTLGLKGAMGARRENLELLVSQIPRGSTWSVSGIGRHQMAVAEMGIALGGHVRVGLENGLYARPGQLARGNAELVAAVADMARRRGRGVATPADARAILGLGG